MVDGTLGGGGHAAEIIKKIGPRGTFLGIDRDERALESCRSKFGGANRIFVAANYADLPEILKKKDLPRANGLLLDLGFSSEQLDASGRGFSFAKDEPLLMTFDADSPPVRDILRGLRESELVEIIRNLSGERFAKRIARAIKAQETKAPIRTTGELKKVIEQAVPRNYEMRRIHPATRTFQALRIYANKELENLEHILRALPEILVPGGRAVIISFHSLEDRLVKNYFRNFKKDGTGELLTPKPVSASRDEIEKNRRSRSAKLRALVMR